MTFTFAQAMALCVAWLALGLVIGALLARAVIVRPSKRQKPICTCSHGSGMHVDGGCRGTVKQAIEWKTNDYGQVVPVHWTYEPCACLKYDGPVLLPEFYIPGEIER